MTYKKPYELLLNILSVHTGALLLTLVLSQSILNLLVGVIFLFLIPFIAENYVYKFSKGTDREKRYLPYILVVLSYWASFIIFLLTENIIMTLIAFCYATISSIFALINLKWKISVSAAGISIPSTLAVLIFGLQFIFLFVLLFPIGFISIKLNKHSILQTLAGSIVAILITFVIYLNFSL